VNRLRLAVVVSHPIQYFAPLFQRLAQRSDLDVTVYYCSRRGLETSLDPGFGVDVKWDIPLIEGYCSVFLADRAFRPTGFWSVTNPAIVPRIIRGRYDVLIVHGYATATAWLATVAAKFVRTKVLMRAESQLLNRKSLLRRVARRVVLTPYFALLDGALFLGKENERFYQEYGMPKRKLTHVPYTVDNEFFGRHRALRTNTRLLRDRWGIPANTPVIVCCAKLIAKKQPLHLLEAFAHVRSRYPSYLLFVGDGELRPQILERARSLGIHESVRVTGFLNQSEISDAYAVADLFVLPSAIEPWGLVINEAMNFALPIVTTDCVGAAADLVQEGKNGFVVPRHDVDALADRLTRLVTDNALRQRFGSCSLDIISRWSLDAAVNGIISGVQKALRSTM
jgi:glycosyltransferase involved in cell wall biosynthesis